MIFVSLFKLKGVKISHLRHSISHHHACIFSQADLCAARACIFKPVLREMKAEAGIA